MTPSQSTVEMIGSSAAEYLHLAGEALAAGRAAVPALAALGERMAEPLLAGGDMFIPAIAEFWPHEFCYRAGGLMGLRQSAKAQNERDVAYIALPDPRHWDPAGDEALQTLIASPAQIFVNGRAEDLAALGSTDRFAGFTGGASPDAGPGRFGEIQPLVPLRVLDQLVRGWALAGEMITACIRGGRMPTIYMSVWLEGAVLRNASVSGLPDDNRHEPGGRNAPLFHETRYIPPIPPEAVAQAYIEEAERLHAALTDQTDALRQAGQWMAQARQAGQRVHCVAVGHSYPRILELQRDRDYPVTWGRSSSNLGSALPEELGTGDVAIHLGYAPVQLPEVRQWLDRGVRLVHTSPYGRPDDWPDHENLLWLDLPWRPADATIDVPGYGVRILPTSAVAHTMAYFAMLCEMVSALARRG